MLQKQIYFLFRLKCGLIIGLCVFQMAPDYDHLTLMEKVEVFEHAVNNTAGDDLAKLLWLKSPSSEVRCSVSTWKDDCVFSIQPQLSVVLGSVMEKMTNYPDVQETGSNLERFSFDADET